MPEYRIEIRNDYCLVCESTRALTVVAFLLDDRNYLGVCLECLERMAKNMMIKYGDQSPMRLTPNSYYIMFDNTRSGLELSAGCDCSVCGAEEVLGIEARYYPTAIDAPIIAAICVDCIRAAIHNHKEEFRWATC